MNNNIIDSITSNELGIDDVVLNADCFRMERMDERTFWIAAYNGNVRTTFTISASGCKISAVVTEDHNKI